MTKKQYVVLVVLTVFAGLIGGAVASWFLTSHPAFAQKTPPTENIIEARSFHLVDRNGSLRGGLTILDDGTAGLVLTNNNARAAIKLIINPNGKSSVTLYDNTGQGRALFAVESDGTPNLHLQSGAKSSAALSFSSDGNPSLSFLDKDGKLRAALGSVDFDAARTSQMGKRPVSSLILFDKDERIVWEAP